VIENGQFQFRWLEAESGLTLQESTPKLAQGTKNGSGACERQRSLHWHVSRNLSSWVLVHLPPALKPGADEEGYLSRYCWWKV